MGAEVFYWSRAKMNQVGQDALKKLQSAAKELFSDEEKLIELLGDV
jgi:hypothetical protein